MPTTTLFGRSRELDALRTVFGRLAEGFTQMVVIEGEPGIGKTSLVREAAQEAEERGFQVFYGSAAELDRDRPFGALAEALALHSDSEDAERAELAGVLAGTVLTVPELPLLAQTPDLRFKVMEGVIALVEHAAVHGPVLLIMDDVHWSDPGTLVALGRMVRRLGYLPLGVVLTLRPVSHGSEVARFVQSTLELGAVHLLLAPLDDGSIEALVSDRLGKPAGPRLLHHVAGAGGNPFYATELLATMESEDAIDRTHAEIRGNGVPRSLRAAVLRRLGAMSPETLEILQAAAVLGSAFSMRELSIVAGRSEKELVQSLMEAIRLGVLGETEGRVAFRHDLVRQALYEDLPLPLRRGLHRHAGRVLAAAGVPSQQVATQLSLGAEPGDQQAVQWLRRAARDTGSRSPKIAANFVRRAIELVRATDPQRAEMVSELAWFLLWSGELAEAEELARDELRTGPSAAVGGLLRYILARALVHQGRVSESLQQLEIGLAIEGLPSRIRGRLLGDLGLRRFHVRDLDGARAAAEQLLAEARFDDAFARCAGLAALALIAVEEGRVHEGVKLAQEAVAVSAADPAGEADLIGPRVYLAIALYRADRLADAAEVVEEALNAPQTVFLFAPVLHAIMALVRYQWGQWDRTLAEAQTSLELATEAGVRVYNIDAYATLAFVGLHRDDLPRAAEAEEAALRELAASGPARVGLARFLWARALLDEMAGDVEAAALLLAGTWDLTSLLGMPGECIDLAPDLVRTALATGRRDLAEAAAADVEQLARRMGTDAAEATGLRCRGLVETDADKLLSSARRLRKRERNFELAHALEDAGMALEQHGRREEAIVTLDEAAETFEGIGAVRGLARVQATLRGLGVRRGRRGPRRRPQSGWDSLTPTELEVARLVAEGMTNRQIGERLFVSRWTVSTHVSHMLAKLGISTRTQLASLMARRSA